MSECLLLKIELLFLLQLVNVEKSSVNYYPSKVEIKLSKKEPGSWAKLEVPSHNKCGGDTKVERQAEAQTNISESNRPVSEISDQVESVDLSCI